MRTENLFRIYPDFDWNIFNYNYEIAYDKKPKDIVLVLLSIYAANYIISSIAGTKIVTTI